MKDSAKEKVVLGLGGLGPIEAKELHWEALLDVCLSALGKSRWEAAGEKKFAQWKVAVSVWMRGDCLCRHAWLSELFVGGDGCGAQSLREALEGR